VAQRVQAIVTSSAFKSGYEQGMQGILCGNIHLPDHLQEETAIALVRNLCEIAQEGWLKDDLMRRDVGVLVGWIMGIAQ
jgi:hypothetical protein